MNIEKRKIQKTGKSTYIVSLPKPWVSKNNLSSGDIVAVSEEKDKSLRIFLSDIKEKIKEETINFSHFKNHTEVIRKFTTLYLNGANRINIIFDNKSSIDQRNNIIENIRRFIGLEIIEESVEKIVIQDFFSSEYLSISKSIKRAFNISKLVIKETINMLENPTLEIKNINLWESETDRLYFLVRRQLNCAIHNSIILDKLNLTLSECMNYLILIWKIEKITDAFQKMCTNIQKNQKIKLKYVNLIKVYCNEVLDLYCQAIDSIFKKDFSLANGVINAIHKKIPSIADPSEIAKIEDYNVYYILFYIHRSFSLVNDIAEIGLDFE